MLKKEVSRQPLSEMQVTENTIVSVIPCDSPVLCWSKKDSKPVKRFSAVFSNQNKSKIVLESVIWAYKFQIWFAGAWKLSQKTIMRWNPREIFGFLKILVWVRNLVKYEVLTPSELGDILILLSTRENIFFARASADVRPPSLMLLWVE